MSIAAEKEIREALLSNPIGLLLLLQQSDRNLTSKTAIEIMGERLLLDEFVLIDLVSQASAVQRRLAGMTRAERLDWLSGHGQLSEIQARHPEALQTYCFESNTGIRSVFFFDEDSIVFVGDNTTFTAPSD